MGPAQALAAGQWPGAAGGAYTISSFTLDLNAIRIAHASQAIAAMLVFFPFGGVIIRLVDVNQHRHIVWCEYFLLYSCWNCVKANRMLIRGGSSCWSADVRLHDFSGCCRFGDLDGEE